MPINSVSQHSEKLSTAVSGHFQVAGSRRLQSAAISARGREEGGRRRPRRGFQGAALLGLIASQGVCPPVSRSDWQQQLSSIREYIDRGLADHLSPASRPIAIGEVGLDFYWSREFEQEQQEAFEQQVEWSVETRLPLMIHCRKAQNELVSILKRYASQLPGGVFHCFTGNEQEARQLLEFPQFVLGIGGVLTFKKSHLPEVLPACVPLHRIVLETDAPYMSPVPLRGQRNESAFIPHVIARLAEAYGVSEEEICRQTTLTADRIFFG